MVRLLCVMRRRDCAGVCVSICACVVMCVCVYVYVCMCMCVCTDNSRLKQKRGDARRVDHVLRRISLLCWETVIKYYSVSDIAALQQHDKVERG